MPRAERKSSGLHPSRQSRTSSADSIAPVGLAGELRMRPLSGARFAFARSCARKAALIRWRARAFTGDLGRHRREHQGRLRSFVVEDCSG
eukprot:5230542-Pleurochrysis_carterae.AAC.1